MEQRRSTVLVSELLEEGEALLVQALGRLVLARDVGRAAAREQRAGANEGLDFPRLRVLEQAREPAHPLARVVDDPEVLDRRRELESQLHFAARERPLEGGADVVLLGCGDVVAHGSRHVERVRVDVRVERDSQEELRMAVANVLRVRRFVEPLGAVLADRVQHSEAPALPAAEQALGEERLERVQVGPADRLRRLDREASSEDREAPEELLLRGDEELVAPLDRGAQRLLLAGASRALEVRSGSRCSSRRSSSSGSRSATRAAASSIASGSPSSRRQISPTAVDARKPGATACARSAKSDTASSSGSGSTG